MIKQDISGNQARNIYLAIGSNLGNRKLNIERTKFHLNEKLIKLIKSSEYYETPSWPDPKKPKFLNIVIKVKCNFEPNDLLKICKTIEVKLGRKKALKNSPRVCDIDIIDFNGLISKKKLILPHKLMHKRSFVLLPLFEIEKQWLHPIFKTYVKKLIYYLPNKDIRSIKKV